MIPGEIFPADAADVVLNAGRRTQVLAVRNTGDRAIQVGSHFHFFEANRALEFDRAQALGMRLDIPAGTAVRFEPGAELHVTLVDFGGRRHVVGFNGLVDGDLDAPGLPQSALRRAADGGFKGATPTIANDSAKGCAQAERP